MRKRAQNTFRDFWVGRNKSPKQIDMSPPAPSSGPEPREEPNRRTCKTNPDRRDIPSQDCSETASGQTRDYQRCLDFLENRAKLRIGSELGSGIVISVALYAGPTLKGMYQRNR
jgi:hypothetical protein